MARRELAARGSRARRGRGSSVSRTVAGTVFTKRRPGRAEDLPVHEGLAAAGALELLGQAVARRRARTARSAARGRCRAGRARGPRSPRAARVSISTIGWKAVQRSAVVDDLEQRLALVALAQAGGAGRREATRVLDQPQDLALLALERAPEHEAVADVDRPAARAGRAGSGGPRAGSGTPPRGRPACAGRATANGRASARLPARKSRKRSPSRSSRVRRSSLAHAAPSSRRAAGSICARRPGRRCRRSCARCAPAGARSTRTAPRPPCSRRTHSTLRWTSRNVGMITHSLSSARRHCQSARRGAGRPDAPGARPPPSARPGSRPG